MNNSFLKIGLVVVLLFSFIQTGWSQNEKPGFPNNSYKYFTGTIGDRPVTAEIYVVDSIFQGHYSQNGGKEIALIYLKYRSKNNQLVLAENGIPGVNTNSLPIWKCTFSGGKLIGTWYSKGRKKTFTIALKENYPPGVMRFTYAYVHKEIPAFPQKKKSDSFGITYIYPKALGDGAKAQFLNGEVKNLLGFKSGVTFANGIKEQYRKHAKKYMSWVQEFKNTGDTDTYPLDWHSLTQINIIYNENDFVQLHIFQQGYFGGAHSGHSEGNLIYDMKDDRLLSLEDLTAMDSVQLQGLIEAQFRKGHGLQPDDSLNTILFKNYLALTENFSFNQQGIQFIYNPYEVGPYSMGTIHVFIPYEKLKGTLVPEFKKRIHL